MPSFTAGDMLIWFAHCPKAGGTSIETLMVEAAGIEVDLLHWGWDVWYRDGGWRADGPPNSPQHLVWADAEGRLPRAPDAVFATVRDPAARLQSEWRWQRSGRRGTRIGKALARLPFSLWLPLMLAMAARHPYSFDNHLRPQADFPPGHAVIFPLEKGLEPVVAWLRDIAGVDLPAQPPHQLKTDMGGEDLSPADMGLIATAFERDYDRFGYDRPDVPGREPGLVWRLLAVPLVWLDRRGRL